MKKHDLLIHNVASKYILGEAVNIEIKGNQQQLQKLSELLDISKTLYTSLHNQNIPLSKIMTIVENKKKLADEFYQLSGIKWKL
jgi:hypothetical protein